MGLPLRTSSSTTCPGLVFLIILQSNAISQIPILVQERFRYQLRGPRHSHHPGDAPAGGPGDEGRQGGAEERGDQGEGEEWEDPGPEREYLVILKC